MTRSPSPRKEPSRPAGDQVRGLTRHVTDLIRLAGGAIAVNELVIRGELRPAALAVVSLMLLGAQATEDIILKAIDRFFDRR